VGEIMSGAAKHTPGPWAVGNARKHSRWIDAPEWDRLAKVITRMDGADKECDDGLANARLIAAAPELLDALQALRGACVDEGWLLKSKYWLVLDKARAAIAKATGEAA